MKERMTAGKKGKKGGGGAAAMSREIGLNQLLKVQVRRLVMEGGQSEKPLRGRKGVD